MKAEALRAPISHQQKILHSTYCDTANLRLRKAHSVLRVRKADGKDPVLCFKSLSPNETTIFHRMEIEVPAPDGRVDVSLFDAPTAKFLLRLTGGKSLQPQFDVNVKRQALLIFHEGAEIEVCADEGEVISGTKSSNIVELELELKSGEESGLYALAAQLAHEFPLSLSFVNKSERGFRLIGKSRSAPVVIRAIKLSSDMSMDDIIQTSLSHAIYQVTANWHGLTDKNSTEAVHQMRIALRRLRVFLSVFFLVYPCNEFVSLKREGRAIARILGKVRNLDVLAQSMPKFFAASIITKKDAKSLLSVIADRRALASNEAAQLFKGEAAAQFIFHAQAVIAKKAWNHSKPGGELPDAQSTPEAFARLALENLYKRVRLRGRKFETLSTEKLHSVRIALKALSSTAGAFSGLTKKRKNVADFDAALLHLQQGLGQFNDNVFALQFCEDIAGSESGAVKQASKNLARELKRNQISLQSKLHKRWIVFKKIKPYWT